MLLDDITNYIAASTSLSVSLTVGSNLFKTPAPETVASTEEHLVEVLEYGGRSPMRAMGASKSDPVAEITRFQVAVISNSSTFEAGRTLIEEIKDELDYLSEATLGSTRYLQVKMVQPPMYWSPEAPSGQHHFTASFEAMKERG